jgi:hypothetical protein
MDIPQRRTARISEVALSEKLVEAHAYGASSEFEIRSGNSRRMISGCRTQGRYTVDFVLRSPRSLPQIDSTLRIQPKFRAVAEKASQTQRHLRTHRSALAEQFVHCLA